MSIWGEPSPAPSAVHGRARELTGHAPHWLRKAYRGGRERIDHYRTCSYCRCIHPRDMISLLRAGAAKLITPPGASGHKRILVLPNPVAGRLVWMGGDIGPVFKRGEFHSLPDRLAAPADPEWDPSPQERLSGHFERPAKHRAPPFINQPFFLEHTTEAQWAEIEAAIIHGERHASPLSRAP